MAQRVTAIFTDREDAEDAADALVSLGADRGHISTVVRHEDDAFNTATAAETPHGENMIEPAREVGDSGAPLTTTDEPEAAKGAAAGAMIGAVAGIVAGAAMPIVPGVGPILAAGPLSWAIGGAVGATVAGAVAGGVYGSLRDIGISEPHARAYEERVRGGDILMTALLPNLAESRVRDVLAEHNAEDVIFVDDTSALSNNIPVSDTVMAPPAGPSAYGMDRTLAAPAAVSETYVESTTVAGYNANIARGETKQIERERRDSAAGRALDPLQEEYSEEEEPVDQRA